MLYWYKSTRYKSTNTDAAHPQSSLNLYWFLGREEFKYTCIGSNTAHLMLQPSPPANLLSIYEAVATKTKREFPGEKIALMCTSLSMKHVDVGYAEIFKKHGLEFVKPRQLPPC